MTPAERHKQISYVKSLVRVAGYVVLMLWVSPIAGLILIASEMLGIAEEIWGT